MLTLARVYESANPDHDATVSLLAIKRKFMAGISPSLREKVFIFCPDPYAAGVSRETLLGYCRSARSLLQMNAESTTSSTTDRVLSANNNGNIEVGTGAGGDSSLLAAFNNFTLRMDDHMRSTDSRLDEIENTISSMYSPQNNYRGRGNFQNRGGNRGGYRGGNRGGYRGGNNNQNGSGAGRGARGRGGFNNNSNRGNFNNSPIRCFNCNGFNHRARDCTANSGN